MQPKAESSHAPGAPSVLLEPEQDVEVIDGRTSARSDQPWLRVQPAAAFTAHRWVRVRYSTNLFDDPVRPSIRFRKSDGSETVQTMNGAVLGSAEWVGRVPDGTAEVFISPTNRPGRFDFRIERIERASRLKLLLRGMQIDPFWAVVSLGARAINSREEARQTLKFAATATPLAEYHDWYAARVRPIDLDGIDARHADWQSAPVIRLFASAGSKSAEALERTLVSLRAQLFPRWSLHLLADEKAADDLLDSYRAAQSSDARLAVAAADVSFADDVATWVGVMELGDVLPDHALAAFVEALAGRPEPVIAYGDEDSIGVDGRLHTPRFKPDWSPEFYAASPYLGRLTLVRASELVRAGCRSAAQLVAAEDAVIAKLAAGVSKESIRHVRRVVYRRVRALDAAAASIPLQAPAVASTAETSPSVTIVVPTRDRARLLGACLKGLREMTDYRGFEVVVVDNGSTQPEAVALLHDIRADPRFHVLKRPGPFSYAALCNDGARVSQATVLVFLNNDIAMGEPGWLRPLVRWALRPHVGAVGAKLLFPNGRIQHGGVVLGMGGLAGHPYRASPRDNPGYLGRLRVPHEVPAVTGACLAVERAKFEAVGGYDAVNLPIELNDTDLCLRLAERGWTTIWTPESVLFHHESASRGRQVRPYQVYRNERRHFAQRWAQVIRDDPYFHPALSLFSHRPSLA